MALQTVQATAVLSNSLGALVNAPIVFAYMLSGASTQTSLGTVNTNGSGYASVSQSLAGPDVYNFFASFNGLSGELASSGLAAITVAALADSTSTSLGISPANPTTTQSIAFSGIVEDTTAATGLNGVPVLVILDSSSVDTATTTANGDFAGTLSELSAGSHTLTATFSGNSAEKPSSSTINFTVTQAVTQKDSTVLTIGISPMNPLTGETIAFSGILTDTTTSTSVPSASISINLDSAADGTSTTTSDGSYGGSLTGVGAGNHTLIATFNGNSADKSSSATSNFTVTTSGTITSGITTSGANNNTALIVGGIVAAGAVVAYFLL